MKQIICYDVEKLLKILPNHGFRRIECVEEGDEYFGKGQRLLFVSPDVVSVFVWLGTFGDTMKVSLKNGEKVELHSNNVNTRDETLLRIGKTKYLSPDLVLVNDGLVETSENLIEWLHKYAVLPGNISDLDQYLEQISSSYTFEEEITYTGVPTPVRYGTSWGYSSTPLVLRASEVDQVLNGINDDLLREKIKCVLYARIFQKRG